MKLFSEYFAELETAVIKIAPPHIAIDNAPDTWKKLQAWKAQSNSLRFIPVWKGASEKTIYSSSAGNFAFRAWHDSLHLLLHLSFNFAHELEAAKIHCRAMQRVGLSSEAIAALYFDTAGQSIYEKIHGEFPVNQRRFVCACLQTCSRNGSGIYTGFQWLRNIAYSVSETQGKF